MRRYGTAVRSRRFCHAVRTRGASRRLQRERVMNPKEYIRAKEEQLIEWERALDKDALGGRVDAWRKKRDEVKAKLEALKSDTSDRWDVLRMGLESAWDELKAAFETATQRDLHGSSAE